VKKEMKKKSASTNQGLKGLITLLDKAGKEKGVSIWRDLAKKLASSRKNRAQVNVSTVSRHTKAKDVVAVPGKLLGAGAMGHAVTVAALSFSQGAKEKITNAGGKCISFEDLLKENPNGSSVKIMRGV
jgi:large subunit ribosomal protein L18e